MRRGRTFSDVLDEKLHEETVDSAPRAARAGFHPPTTYGFFVFADNTTSRHVSSARVTYVPSAAAAPKPPVDTAAPEFIFVHADGSRTQTRPRATVHKAPTPRRRVLSFRQQRALARLVDLGATIDADFTDQELRRTFKTLARRYHPDVHPTGTAREKAELSLLFTQLRDAYTELQIPAAA